MNDFPVLTLKSGRRRSLDNRHPWIFSGAVKQLPNARVGDTIRIVDNNGETLAFGHYAPHSQIVCRIFHFGTELPTTEEELWKSQFRRALASRKNLLDTDQTNGFRLLHAEGDQCPGLITDLYGTVASVQLRTTGGIRAFPWLSEFLTQEAGITSLFYRADPKTEDPDDILKGQYAGWLKGESGPSVFKENGLEFQVDAEEGQKTGFFLDQRDNRELLRSLAKGREVLNCFSYTGGFSVYALSGGAKQVVSIDASNSATALCKENIALNFGPDAPHEALSEDCFQYLKELEQDRFDLIVLDPPAFSKHKSTVKKAARGYKEINLKAIRKIRPGGLLFTFSCSQHISRDLFRKIVYGAAADAGRPARILFQLSQGADHPVDIFHPEGEYLKGLVLQVD